MRAHFGLPSVENDELEGKPPITVKFEIPYFTVSGIQVCCLNCYKLPECKVVYTREAFWRGLGAKSCASNSTWQMKWRENAKSMTDPPHRVFDSCFEQVRYMKIIEKSGYQALPWVRYITQSGGNWVFYLLLIIVYPDVQCTGKSIWSLLEFLLCVVHKHDNILHFFFLCFLFCLF